MRLNGNHYSAVEDRMGNIVITRKSDLKTCYLQGDDAVEFIDNHRILDAWAAWIDGKEYPSGPFKTPAEHVDACLDCYSEVMN